MIDTRPRILVNTLLSPISVFWSSGRRKRRAAGSAAFLQKTEMASRAIEYGRPVDRHAVSPRHFGRLSVGLGDVLSHG